MRTHYPLPIFVLGLVSRAVIAQPCLPRLDEPVSAPVAGAVGFGAEVAASPDHLAISDTAATNPGLYMGRVYILARSNPSSTLEQICLPDGLTGAGIYGIRLAIEGDCVAIGSVSYTTSGVFRLTSGWVDIFVRRTDHWERTQRLRPAETIPTDTYGYAVAMRGDLLAVGATSRTSSANEAGAVYLYRRSGETWAFESRLQPISSSQSIAFGLSVAIDSGRIFVGAPSDTGGFHRPGSVYVFEHIGNIWQQQARMVAPDEAVSFNYGQSISAAGTQIAVGSSDDTSSGFSAGAVYVHEYTPSSSQWEFRQLLLPPSIPPGSSQFGWDVAFDGTNVMAGAYSWDAGATNTGAGFLFRKVGGSWVNQFSAIGNASEFVGYSVSIADKTAFLGASGMNRVLTVDLNPHLPGDADSDGLVGMKDVMSVLANFGASYGAQSGPGDADGGGTVNFADVVAALRAWGSTCL